MIMLLSFRSELTPNRNPVGTDRRGAELPLRTAQRSSRRRRVARTMVPRDDNGAANCLPPTDAFAVATAECDAARTDPPCCQPRRRAARTIRGGLRHRVQLHDVRATKSPNNERTSKNTALSTRSTCLNQILLQTYLL